MVIAALLASESLSAAASISVDGAAEAVSVRTVDAPLRDVLDLLRTRFGLRYRSQSTLDTEKTVTLVAPLRQVVVRLLEGYDFVIAATPTGLEVLIVQQSAAANHLIPQVRPALAPPPPLAPSTEDERRERG
jgi:hypothetical protein